MTMCNVRHDETEYITQSAVMAIGFTKTMIKILLPEPVLKSNPRYRSAAPMRLYRVADVNAAMESEAFHAAQAKAEARKVSAQKAVETKQRAAEELVNRLIANVEIERIDVKELENHVVLEKEDEYTERGQELHCLNDATVQRWMVNYIRHNLCNYDRDLTEIEGKVGNAYLYSALKNATLSKIAQVYPELASECERQKMA